MKKISFLSALIVFAMVGPLVSMAAAQDSAPGTLDRDGYRAMIDDIEIMKRVINKSLQAHFSDQDAGARASYFRHTPTLGRLVDESEDVDVTVSSRYADSAALPYLNFATPICEGVDTQGFYVPGSGVVFSFDVAVAAAEAPGEAKEEEAESDLWQQAEIEYLKREHAVAYTLIMQENQKKKDWIADPEALDEVLGILIETIGSHGHNMTGLDKNDRITLLIGVKGRIPQSRYVLPPGDPAAAALFFYGAAKGAAVDLENVIIQIPIAYITLFQETKDRAALKKAVTILRYPAKAEKANNRER